MHQYADDEKRAIAVIEGWRTYYNPAMDRIQSVTA